VSAMTPWWSTNKPTSLVPEPHPDDQEPSKQEGDWLDRLWADADLAPAPPAADEPEAEAEAEAATEEQEEDQKSPGGWFVPQPGYWPTPTVEVPKPSLSDGTKRFLYNVGAGAAGWAFQLTPTIGGWIADCGRDYSISAALVLGGGICLGIAVFWDSRTRHWRGGLDWVARIPLASALTALALYAPASTL
jgi:hypothetical protein